MPISSIVMENFRDGLDDYAYFKILEIKIQKAGKLKKKSLQIQQWLETAKPLITVPKEIVESVTVYTKSPEKFQAYRNKIALAIEQAPSSL